MTPQFKPAAYKNVESERELFSACPRLSGRVLTLRDRDRKQRFCRRTAIDLGHKYHHTSNANLGTQNPALDSHVLFVGLSLFQ
jgi:hypothetical protein